MENIQLSTENLALKEECRKLAAERAAMDLAHAARNAARNAEMTIMAAGIADITARMEVCRL